MVLIYILYRLLYLVVVVQTPLPVHHFPTPLFPAKAAAPLGFPYKPAHIFLYPVPELGEHPAAVPCPIVVDPALSGMRTLGSRTYPPRSCQQYGFIIPLPFSLHKPWSLQLINVNRNPPYFFCLWISFYKNTFSVHVNLFEVIIFKTWVNF